MRKFWLENSNGKLWDLTTDELDYKTGTFFANPDGLGIKTKISSYEVENTFFIESVTTQSQTISGDLYFVDYDHYQRFVAFIGNVNSDTPMKLYYSTNGKHFENVLNKEWYKLVLITELKKGEIDIKTSALKVPVKFECLSRWKQDKEIVLELSRTGDPLVYPYVYPYFYGGSNNLAVTIDNTGNLATSCRVKVEGITESPLFRILKDGEVTDQAMYHITVGANSYLIVDSSADKQEATLYSKVGDESVHEDVYYTGEKNYTFSNFLTIPPGISTFIVSALNSNFGKVTLSYSIQKELI